jgi:hypothetical protein
LFNVTSMVVFIVHLSESLDVCLHFYQLSLPLSVFIYLSLLFHSLSLSFYLSIYPSVSLSLSLSVSPTPFYLPLSVDGDLSGARFCQLPQNRSAATAVNATLPPASSADNAFVLRQLNVYVSTKPLLTPEACEAVIAYCKGKFEPCGHTEANTVDVVSVTKHPSLAYAVWPLLQQLQHVLQTLYGVTPYKLPDWVDGDDKRNLAAAKEWAGPGDWQVNRYEANSANDGLCVHRDSDSHSFIFNLNEGFCGGGTCYVNVLQPGESIVRKPTGYMAAHCGQVCHSGVPVTEGVRYILTGSVCTSDCEHSDQGGDFAPTLEGDAEAVAVAFGRKL